MQRDHSSRRASREASTPKAEPRRALRVALDVPCGGCGAANYAKHRFCGWCGIEMGAPRVPGAVAREITAVDAVESAARSDNTSPGGKLSWGELPAADDATVMHAPRPTSVPDEGLTVVLLGEAGGATRRQPIRYRLEFGEPFDVDGPRVESPGTFTATFEGLRLDSLGALEGVYVRIRRGESPIPHRRVRVIRDQGNFQALAPGETIPLGALAILDRVLVRIEAS